MTAFTRSVDDTKSLTGESGLFLKHGLCVFFLKDARAELVRHTKQWQQQRPIFPLYHQHTPKKLMHMLCLPNRKADEKISPSVFKMIITHMALILELIAGWHIIAKRCKAWPYCWLSCGSSLKIFNSFHQPANKLIVQ